MPLIQCPSGARPVVISEVQTGRHRGKRGDAVADQRAALDQRGEGSARRPRRPPARACRCAVSRRRRGRACGALTAASAGPRTCAPRGCGGRGPGRRSRPGRGGRAAAAAPTGPPTASAARAITAATKRRRPRRGRRPRRRSRGSRRRRSPRSPRPPASPARRGGPRPPARAPNSSPPPIAASDQQRGADRVAAPEGPGESARGDGEADALATCEEEMHRRSRVPRR